MYGTFKISLKCVWFPCDTKQCLHNNSAVFNVVSDNKHTPFGAKVRKPKSLLDQTYKKNTLST